MASDRWLVVGLGNPEPEYAGTRHNIGAVVARAFAANNRASFSRKRRLNGELADSKVQHLAVSVLVPATYMNASGGPVQAAARWLKVAVDQIVVCHDDLDLELGTVRLKQGGGNGGHNGLRDIDRALGTRDYHRVRLGISRPPDRIPPRDHVLGRFRPEESDAVDRTVESAVEAIEVLLTQGLDVAQRQFHRRERSVADNGKQSTEKT